MNISQLLKCRSNEEISHEIGLKDTQLELFNDLTWEVILNIYCTPKKELDAIYFKDELSKLSFDLKSCHKIYYFFQKLKDHIL